ncbi:olfactory receptor 10A7-like [Eleutherodactylus coqui]|uniref:olfactory receptor 10A7-like n=1 Tax=Eleutherodactylus coqui TaxID=57060 RepID=UPI0034626D92
MPKRKVFKPPPKRVSDFFPVRSEDREQPALPMKMPSPTVSTANREARTTPVTTAADSGAPDINGDLIQLTAQRSLPSGVVNNMTAATEFFLLGFQSNQNLRLSLFCIFLVIYCGTICGNLLIITLVSTSKNLQTPMYFFISQLSISDILVITDVVPNLLYLLLNNGGTITFSDCITQLYFLCAPEVFECFLLTVMSYDRYVAICNPLRYSIIMTSGHCVILTITCWLLGFSAVLIYIIKMAKLIFCGPHVIDHLFCDIVPLLDLSCSDTFIIHLEIYLLTIPFVLFPTAMIFLSYTYIVLAILKISSNTGSLKAFSTCSSHLIVVVIFYWSLFCVYVVPTKGQTVTIGKILSLLYTVFTPLINPIIYSLRNKDIMKAIQEKISRHMS